MTEPTITCPNCKTEIKLTESLAAPLIESTRKQFEQQLAQKDSDIATREQAMREKEKQLSDAKQKLDEQVADQVEAQLKKDRTRIVAEEAKKAKQSAASDLEQKAREVAALQEVLKSREEKLAEAQKAQAALIVKQRELDDAKRELELTVQKRVQEGLDATRQQAKKEAEDEQKLKVMEKEQTIAAMQKQIEDLKRRAEQGSQQLQGEVQEMFKANNAKLAEAQKAQAELIKKERALDEEKRELGLTVEKRIQEGLTDVRTQAKKEAEESLNLKVMEKEQTITAMQKQVTDCHI